MVKRYNTICFTIFGASINNHSIIIYIILWNLLSMGLYSSSVQSYTSHPKTTFPSASRCAKYLIGSVSQSENFLSDSKRKRKPQSNENFQNKKLCTGRSLVKKKQIYLDLTKIYLYGNIWMFI